MYYAKAQVTALSLWTKWRRRFPYATSLTDGDVLNVLRALIRQMKVQLAAGKIVKMEKTSGHSRFVCSTGTETKKEFTANNITAAHIQFRPGKMVKVATRSEALSFTKVTGKKESIVDDPTDPSEPSNPGDSGNGEAPDPAA